MNIQSMHCKCKSLPSKFNLDINCSIFICVLWRTPWRNGSASDSRSEGCVFKSRRGQQYFCPSFVVFFVCGLELTNGKTFSVLPYHVTVIKLSSFRQV
jgi:hypothetical protein